MDCSTIIVSYNTFDLTREAVRTALDGARGLAHQVIVVDNASPDRTASRLREIYRGDDRVVVLSNDENRGFSAANNQGAAVSSGRVLFFLNPDTIVHTGAIRRLVHYLETHPGVGAIGPRVLNVDGTHQVSTANFESYGSILHHCFPVFGGPRSPRTEYPVEVDVINGCALALRRDAFDAVGGWDERYFMYSEESELCLALHQAGYVNVFVPEAVITHYGGAASADRYVEQQILASQSTDAFLRRHGTASLVLFNRVVAATGYGVRAGVFAVLSRLRSDRADEYARRGAAATAIWKYHAFRTA